MTSALLKSSMEQLEALLKGPRPSTWAQAQLSKCTHQFVRGTGYVDHGEAPPLPARLTRAGTECDPPGNPPDGQPHWLLPPGPRSVPMRFAWVARERAWERAGGYRVAFRADYLAHHGWRYVGQA